MDQQARQLERQAQVSGDLESQVRYLRSQLRYKPRMLERIGFAAYMGHKACLQICPLPDDQLFYLKTTMLWSFKAKVWHHWKRFGRTFGKQPAIAALLVCLEYDPVWTNTNNVAAKNELIDHYQKKLQDKKYHAKYSNTMLKECNGFRAWDYDYSYPGLNKKFQERLRDYMWLIGGSSRYIATSAEIIRDIGAKPDVAKEIQQACIDWALHG